MKIIDLRSDTLTMPDREMLETIMTAELGDDGDDISPKAVTKLCNLIFTKKAQK